MTYVVNTTTKATATTLTVFPEAAFEALPVIFLAHVTPSVTGRVQFRDGTTELGAPGAGDRLARRTRNSTAEGAHSLIAVFTPTDTAALRRASSTTSTLCLVANAFCQTAKARSGPGSIASALRASRSPV